MNRIMFCFILMISTFLTTGCEVEDEISINLTGEDSVTLEVFGVYNEQGATCVSEKAYCNTVIDSSGINNSVVGSYNVIYKTIVESEVVSEIIRKVEVIDSIAPVITTTFFESDHSRKIEASDAYHFDNFGSSIAKYGNYVVVGTNGDDDNGGYSGSAYLFKLNDDTFERKITPSDGFQLQQFGDSVSIYGDFIVIGASGKEENTQDGQLYNPGPGSVYIYKISDPSYERKIVASDGHNLDHFGISTAVYGNYVVVATMYTDENYHRYSKQYVYKLDDLQYERIIMEEEVINSEVAINEDYIVVGIVYRPTPDSNTRSVKVYKINDLTYERIIVPTDLNLTWLDRWSISVDENNLVVGSSLHNGSNFETLYDASLYIYKLNDESYERKITNVEDATERNFMTGVSVSGDVIMSAVRVNTVNGLFSGEIQVNKLSDDSFERKIIVDDGSRLDAYVTVVADDDFLLAAAMRDDNEHEDAGSVYLYYLVDGYHVSITDNYEISDIVVLRNDELYDLPEDMILTEEGVYQITAIDSSGNLVTSTVEIE